MVEFHRLGNVNREIKKTEGSVYIYGCLAFTYRAIQHYMHLIRKTCPRDNKYYYVTINGEKIKIINDERVDELLCVRNGELMNNVFVVQGAYHENR